MFTIQIVDKPSGPRPHTSSTSPASPDSPEKFFNVLAHAVFAALPAYRPSGPLPGATPPQTEAFIPAKEFHAMSEIGTWQQNGSMKIPGESGENPSVDRIQVPPPSRVPQGNQTAISSGQEGNSPTNCWNHGLLSSATGKVLLESVRVAEWPPVAPGMGNKNTGAAPLFFTHQEKHSIITPDRHLGEKGNAGTRGVSPLHPSGEGGVPGKAAQVKTAGLTRQWVVQTFSQQIGPKSLSTPSVAAHNNTGALRLFPESQPQQVKESQPVFTGMPGPYPEGAVEPDLPLHSFDPVFSEWGSRPARPGNGNGHFPVVQPGQGENAGTPMRGPVSPATASETSADGEFSAGHDGNEGRTGSGKETGVLSHFAAGRSVPAGYFLSGSHATGQNPPLPFSAVQTQFPTIIQQWVKAIYLEAGEGLHQLTIRLIPEELGTIHIRLRVKENRLEGEIQVNRPETLHQLQQTHRQLLQRLQEMGWQVDQLDVRLAGGMADAHYRQPESRPPVGRTSHALIEDQGEVSEAMDGRFRPLALGYNTIDFIA